MSGRLVVLSGPSGVGKDTVLEAWKKINPMVEKVVATTTRPPRPGEVDTVDYNFVSLQVFDQKVGRGEFLEHKCVHGNYYATPSASVGHLLDEGKFAVLKIDVQGALEVMDKRSDALSIFLLPPSWEALEQRIRGRGTDSPEVIEKRLADARGEMALADRYDFRVVNDDLAETVRELEEIVKVPD